MTDSPVATGSNVASSGCARASFERGGPERVEIIGLGQRRAVGAQFGERQVGLRHVDLVWGWALVGVGLPSTLRGAVDCLAIPDVR